MTDTEQLIISMLRDGFAGVHERLDELNGRTRQLEQRAAVTDEKFRQKRTLSLGTAGVGGGIGVAFAAFCKVLFDLFTK